MQVTPISSYTPVQSIAPNQGVAAVLPKNGEVAVDAVFAPVEPLSEASAQAALHKEPLVYSKPTIVARDTDQADEEQADEKSDALGQEKLGIAEELDEQENKLLAELKARDQEVRNHEQAHKAMGGQHAGAASYTFQQGPDGNRYAVGGEVPIDMSKVNEDPQATLEKMQQIQRAALAPNEPSSQDRQVAAQAGQKAAQALNEIAQQKLEQKEQADLALKADQKKAEEAKQKAKKEQEEADRKAQQDEQVSAAERMALYNSRMTQINETLLKLSMPNQPSAGQLISAHI